MPNSRLAEVYKENPSLESLVFKIKVDNQKLKDKINFIWLIGSYAKGTARKDSDTDLMIVQNEDLEDWKNELHYFAYLLPNIKLQTHRFLNERWQKIKQKRSVFYQGIINEEDHIEVINNAYG